jgi:hypothetical protein
VTPHRWSIRPIIWTIAGWSLAAGLAVVCACQYAHITILENDAAEAANYNAKCREYCRNYAKSLPLHTMP